MPALARALRRRDDEALQLIHEAEAIAPRDYAVAWAGGIIRYTAALSPVVPFFAGEFPNPVNPGLVREDNAARELLQEAERIFDRLARTVDGEDLISDLEVWRLACLVANPAAAPDAKRLATELTSRPLPHPGAVAWAVAGGITLKHDRIVNAYNAAIAAGTGTASQAAAAALALAARGSERRALRTLERARPFFKEASELALIDQWIARLSGHPDRESASDTTGTRHRSAMNALLKGQDPSGIAALIEEGVLDPNALLGAFEALAARRQWPAINVHRNRLLTLETARAVEIAAVAALEGGNASGCLSILHEGRERFHGGRLPHRLRVIEARAHLKMGRPDLALELAESLRAAGPEEGAFALELARLRIGIGDLAGAADAMRRLRRHKDLPNEEIMRIAWELRREDPHLARSLLSDVAWERLQRRMIPSAFTLAVELGLEEAQKVLFPKFQDAARTKQAGVMVMESVEEAIAFAETHAMKRQQAERQLRQRWLAAEIPAHAAFDADLITFARLFHDPFETGPSLSTSGEVIGLPLLLRSGHIRDAVDDDQEREHQVIPRAHLRLDITAVLLGQELGVLDKLARIAETISIPQELPEALTALEDAFAERFRPPSEAVREVLALLDDGALAELDLDQVAGEPSEARIVLEPPNEGRGVGGLRLADLLRSLVTHAGFDAAAAADTLRALDIAPSDDETDTPLLGRRLHLSLRDAITLSGAGGLERLVRFVDVYVDRAEVVALRQQLVANEAGVSHRTLLGNVRRFVADRLFSGAWHFLPEVPQDPELHAIVRSSAVLRSVVSLVKAPGDAAAAVWIEDRTLSMFERLNESSRVDVGWVLERLRDVGVIDTPAYEEAHRRLRQAGYGYRLPEPDEIADALREAPVRDGEIVETERLALYRMDYAIQLANSRHLTDKLPSGPPAQGPEIRFVARLTSFACELQPLLWSNPTLTAERRLAASWWAWRNLRTEQTSFFPRDNPTNEAKRYLVLLCLIRLVTVAFSINGEGWDRALAHRSDYLAWAFGGVIDPLVRVECELRDGIVNHLAHYLAKFLEADAKLAELSPEVLKATVVHLLQAFPEHWRERIQGHELLRAPLEWRTVDRVTVGADLEFEAADFFRAVAAILRSGRAAAPLADTDAIATFEPLPSKDTTERHPARFKVESGNRVSHVEDGSILLAHDDPKVRSAALTQHPEWFDRTGPDLDVIAHEITTIPALNERFARLRAAQERSLPWRMAKLGGQIRVEGRSDRDLLAPPTPDVLREYLRLPSRASGEDHGHAPIELPGAIATAAERLRDEFGSLEALRRLAGIPVPLPAALTEAAAWAVAESGGTLDAALERTGETPLISTALAHAVRRHSNIVGDAARSAMGHLSEVYARQGALFVSLLRWTFRVAARNSEWDAVPEPERSALLWCHANAAMAVLVDEGATPAEVATFLDGFDKEGLAGTFERSRRNVPRWKSLIDPAAHLSTSTLAAAAAVHALTSGDPDSPALQPPIGDSEREAVRAMAAFQIGERWAPQIDLLLPPEETTEHVTWLDVDAGGALARLGLIDLPEPFGARHHELEVLGLLDQVTTDPENAREGEGVWPFLWLTDPARVSLEVRSRLMRAHTAEGLKAAFDAGGGTLMRALTFRAQLLAFEGHRDAFLDLTSEAAREAADRNNRTAALRYSVATDDATTERFLALMESAWAFSSRATADLPDCIRIMADAIDRIASEWKGSLQGCLSLLDGLVRQVPVAAAGPAWDVLNRLRARPLA